MRWSDEIIDEGTVRHAGIAGAGDASGRRSNLAKGYFPAAGDITAISGTPDYAADSRRTGEKHAGGEGGVILARSARDIKLSEIIRVLEGSTAPVDCVDKPDICLRSKGCATRDVWNELKSSVDEVLGKITLADLLERQKRKEQSEGLMYYI